MKTGDAVRVRPSSVHPGTLYIVHKVSQYPKAKTAEKLFHVLHLARADDPSRGRHEAALHIGSSLPVEDGVAVLGRGVSSQ